MIGRLYQTPLSESGSRTGCPNEPGVCTIITPLRGSVQLILIPGSRLAGKQKQAAQYEVNEDAGALVRRDAGPSLGQSSIEGSSMAVADMFDASLLYTQYTSEQPTMDSHYLILTDLTAATALAVIAQRLDLDCQQIPGFNIK